MERQVCIRETFRPQKIQEQTLRGRHADRVVIHTGEKREVVLETVADERAAQIPAEKGRDRLNHSVESKNRGNQVHLARDGRNGSGLVVRIATQ